jgi:hypothetical protein
MKGILYLDLNSIFIDFCDRSLLTRLTFVNNTVSFFDLGKVKI